jgi:hypothetical protein
MAPTLSICIATMNRAAYLRETLEGIARQATPALEVVVLDGGSTDQTSDVVGEFGARMQVVFHRQDGPGGVDRDFDTAVSLATGEYCWLMSDDDALAPGAIELVLGRLADRSLSLILVNAAIWNRDFTGVLNERFVHADEDRRYDVGDDERLFIDTGNYLTFIGGVVIRRDVWMARQRESFYGSLFIHVGVIFQAPLPGPSLLVAAPLVGIRYGNAQWTGRAFEIWMFKWPGLVWSFRFSNAAKALVCRQAPWLRPQTLLIHRAKGSYTLKHYRAFLATRISSPVRRSVAMLIAVTPVILANLAASALLRLFYSDPGVALTDLRSARFSSSTT